MRSPAIQGGKYVTKKAKISDIKLKKGMTTQKKIDFALRKPEIYKPNKILIRKTADHIVAAYDNAGFYYDSLAYGIQLNEMTRESVLYILGLLNSRLLNYVHSNYSLNKKKTFAKVLAINIKKLPIRTIDFSNPKDKAKHDKMVKLVERIIELHERLARARTENEKTMLQRQIDAIDGQIDKLVYELYELTPEEIEIIEKFNEGK
ncbi:MAG: hypothetical protein DRP20_05615 [Thermotogae bacterium]|nr:MAG: hypothetical protein DRP20_05615 [Thermotogota bacterium]